jgi:ATP-binding cassette subfamily B protein
MLLQAARDRWKGATILCITHDVRETLGFQRVLVLESGRVVEDGRPSDLAAEIGSRYRTMLDSEDELRQGLWSNADWRRWRLEKGRVSGNGAASSAD